MGLDLPAPCRPELFSSPAVLKWQSGQLGSSSKAFFPESIRRAAFFAAIAFDCSSCRLSRKRLICPHCSVFQPLHHSASLPVFKGANATQALFEDFALFCGGHSGKLWMCETFFLAIKTIVSQLEISLVLVFYQICQIGLWNSWEIEPLCRLDHNFYWFSGLFVENKVHLDSSHLLVYYWACHQMEHLTLKFSSHSDSWYF